MKPPPPPVFRFKIKFKHSQESNKIEREFKQTQESNKIEGDYKIQGESNQRGTHRRWFGRGAAGRSGGQVADPHQQLPTLLHLLASSLGIRFPKRIGLHIPKQTLEFGGTIQNNLRNDTNRERIRAHRRQIGGGGGFLLELVHLPPVLLQLSPLHLLVRFASVRH